MYESSASDIHDNDGQGAGEMMEQDRREFNRFDIFVVLEFRLLRDRARPFLGVTKNVSSEGLCIDTQCADFQVGEALEVTLKHPEAERFVTLPGKVIWKHKGSKFASMMGITLAEADLDSRTRMLEILAAAGDMPVDNFFLKEQIVHTTEEAEETGEEAPAEEAAEEEVEMEAEVKLEAQEEETAEVEADMKEPVEPVYIHAEHVRDAEDYEIHDAPEHSEQTDTEDSEHEVPSELKLSEPVQEEMDLEPYDNPLYAKSSYKRYAVIAGIVLVLLYAFMSYDPDKKVNGSLEKPASSQKDNASAPIPDVKPQPHAREKDTVKETTEPKVIKEAAVQPRRSVPDKRAAMDKEYVIQVGSWKNEDNARRMLAKLKKYYPDTYMVTENDLKKVRVPGIKDKKEGEKIISDIERRFKVKPLLIVKGH